MQLSFFYVARFPSYNNYLFIFKLQTSLMQYKEDIGKTLDIHIVVEIACDNDTTSSSHLHSGDISHRPQRKKEKCIHKENKMKTSAHVCTQPVCHADTIFYSLKKRNFQCPRRSKSNSSREPPSSHPMMEICCSPHANRLCWDTPSLRMTVRKFVSCYQQRLLSIRDYY